MNRAQKSIPVAYPAQGSEDENASYYGTLAVVGACLATLATLLLPGCSNPSSAHAVDMPRARDALKIVLDEWKKGESPQSLASASTPIVVQDFDWAAGAKLIDYEIVDDGRAFDANLRVQVKLNMSGGQNQSQAKPAEKRVWYLVTTSPKLTVFRDMPKR